MSCCVRSSMFAVFFSFHTIPNLNVHDFDAYYDMPPIKRGAPEISSVTSKKNQMEKIIPDCILLRLLTEALHICLTNLNFDLNSGAGTQISEEVKVSALL